jgi:hypothetical protein
MQSIQPLGQRQPMVCLLNLVPTFARVKNRGYMCRKPGISSVGDRDEAQVSVKESEARQAHAAARTKAEEWVFQLSFELPARSGLCGPTPSEMTLAQRPLADRPGVARAPRPSPLGGSSAVRNPPAGGPSTNRRSSFSERAGPGFA